MTPETAVRNTVCSWLHYHHAFCFIHDSVGIWDPKRKVFRKNHSPYRRPGVADILGIWKGKPLAIECKAKGNTPSPEQREFLDDWNRRGGIGFVAYGIQDCDRFLLRLELPPIYVRSPRQAFDRPTSA